MARRLIAAYREAEGVGFQTGARFPRTAHSRAVAATYCAMLGAERDDALAAVRIARRDPCRLHIQMVTDLERDLLGGNP